MAGVRPPGADQARAAYDCAGWREADRRLPREVPLSQPVFVAPTRGPYGSEGWPVVSTFRGWRVAGWALAFMASRPRRQAPSASICISTWICARLERLWPCCWWPWVLKSLSRRPVYLYENSLMKYTGRCESDANVHGYCRGRQRSVGHTVQQVRRRTTAMNFWRSWMVWQGPSAASISCPTSDSGPSEIMMACFTCPRPATSARCVVAGASMARKVYQELCTLRPGHLYRRLARRVGVLDATP